MWGDEYWSVAHVAAAGQLLSCSGALKYITAVLLQSTSEINGPERWGESNHTNLTLFRNFHPCPPLGGNHPTLEHSVCKNLKTKANVSLGMCVILRTIPKLDHALYSYCTEQTNDIKTSNPDHAVSTQSYPAQTTRFLCQTTRGQRGWGNRDHWPAAITPALRRL